MRVVIACLLLAGCANYPADMLGEPIDEAISHYGKPAAAIDYLGARAFFFPINADESIKYQRTKDLLNPDMPIMKTNFRSADCFYTFNALWTSAYNEWIIHSVEQSQNCGDKK